MLSPSILDGSIVASSSESSPSKPFSRRNAFARRKDGRLPPAPESYFPWPGRGVLRARRPPATSSILTMAWDPAASARDSAASISVTPMMTSFTASTPSGPPPLSANCLRSRSRRCSTSTYVGLYSLRKTCIVASAASPSENCRNVTFVHRVFFEPSCPVEIKGRSSPYVIPSVQFGEAFSQRRGLECKPEELRPRRLALLPGESNRFDVHVAESDASGGDAFSRAHHGPRNGQSKTSVKNA